MDVLILIFRYLRTRRIALIATVFVALAVGAMIVFTSAMDGFRARIHESVRGVEPDLSIRLKSPVQAHFAAVEEELRPEMATNGGVIEALSPRLVTVGFLRTEVQGVGGTSVQREGVKILGVDWDLTRDVIPFGRIISEANDFYLEPRQDWVGDDDLDPFREEAVPGIIVGRVLAGRLGLTSLPNLTFGRTGQATVVTGRVVEDPDPAHDWKIEPGNMTVQVVAGFDSGRDDFDAVHVFMDRTHLYELRYPPGSDRPDCTTIHARLASSTRGDVARVAADLRRRHPNLEVMTWVERNQGLMDALDVEKGTMTLVLGFIVLLTICLIFGLLYMLVIEKTRDVGVLRSMGFTGRKVVLLFLGYGSALGVIGAALGTWLGVTLVQNLNPFLQAVGLQVFNPEVPYRFRGIPTILDPMQVLVIALGTCAVAMVAGALAAWRASVIDPVRCLRYE